MKKLAAAGWLTLLVTVAAVIIGPIFVLVAILAAAVVAALAVTVWAIGELTS